MKPFKTSFSKRKFYHKYSYKVTLIVGNFAGIFRENIHQLKTKKLSFWENHYHHESIANNAALIKQIISFIDEHSSSDMIRRIEGNSIDFYTNNKTLYEIISLSFIDIVKHRFEPRPGVDNSDPSVIYVNKLPHGKYEYKVYLKPHKFSSDKIEKSRYISWLETQKEKIKISDAVKNWFMNTDWNWDRRYIFVKDEPTLLLLSMRNPAAIGKIYRHLLVDK
jgi:hypothetical protein